MSSKTVALQLLGQPELPTAAGIKGHVNDTVE